MTAVIKWHVVKHNNQINQCLSFIQHTTFWTSLNATIHTCFSIIHLTIVIANWKNHKIVLYSCCSNRAGFHTLSPQQRHLELFWKHTAFPKKIKSSITIHNWQSTDSLADRIENFNFLCDHCSSICVTACCYDSSYK